MIRKATADDSRILAEMAIQMWDSNSVDELETEFIEMLLKCFWLVKTGQKLWDVRNLQVIVN
ncbi:MAG: hypothetical protein J6J67_09165 [Treponema sp.]|nr:hypothetical protein [Treponema sp.]